MRWLGVRISSLAPLIIPFVGLYTAKNGCLNISFEVSHLNLQKLDNENFEQYLWRLGQAYDSGELDLSWDELADVINKEIGNEDMPYSSSAFRKPYQQAKKFYEAGVFRKHTDSEYLEEIKLQQQELAKQRVKMRDERTELNRAIRIEARKESYKDMIQRIICENVDPISINVNTTSFNSETDLLCHLTDIHTGIEIDNWKNVFNEDVLKMRIEKYTSDIIKIREIHNSQDCYIVIGEVLSGLIHNNLRLQNNMDLMEQFKLISELISAMLIELSSVFNCIYVYTTAGNHSRITPKKEDALDGENMDILLPFYLKARLQNLSNIIICENEIEPEIAMFNIRGNNIFSSHGHKDKPADVVQNFTMMFGVKPDIVLLGHRHTNGMTTVYDTKVIESGCVSGTDQYAVSIRKSNRPEQTVSVVDKDGLVCLYDIQLD